MVLVPEAAGAVGARPRRERRAARPRGTRLLPLAEAGELPAEGEADLRYRGQSFELTVASGPDLADRFHRAHEDRYGYADSSRTIELVALRRADVRPAPELRLPRADPSSVGPGRARTSRVNGLGAPGVGGG